MATFDNRSRRLRRDCRACLGMVSVCHGGLGMECTLGGDADAVLHCRHSGEQFRISVVIAFADVENAGDDWWSDVRRLQLQMF